MKLLLSLALAAPWAILGRVLAAPLEGRDATDEQEFGRLVADIRDKAFISLDARAAELHARGQRPRCTSKNAVLRRE